MTDTHATEGLRWIKASASEGSKGCVEIAHLAGGTAVRDSKNPHGPMLLFTAQEWTCFLHEARNSALARPAE
jgi:hypothetical protein